MGFRLQAASPIRSDFLQKKWFLRGQWNIAGIIPAQVAVDLQSEHPTE